MKRQLEELVSSEVKTKSSKLQPNPNPPGGGDPPVIPTLLKQQSLDQTATLIMPLSDLTLRQASGQLLPSLAKPTYPSSTSSLRSVNDR